MLSLLLLALCATDPAAELAALAAKVPAFEVIALPATGTLDLSARPGLTIEDLRGVALDPEPPAMGTPATPYPEKMSDDFVPGTAPYEAIDLAPFRLTRFTNEFNYGGWHNWRMMDYAATHGFSILTKYNRAPADFAHYPAGTQVLNWGGFIDWHKWLPEHGLPDGRYDLLVGRDLVAELSAGETFRHAPGYARLMIDMEHGLLSPDKLHEQDWFPKDAPAAEQAAFEKRYYDGYAMTYTAPVEAARRAGWEQISLYGWQPFGRTWFGLEKAVVDPATYRPWLAYGKPIHETVDILNPSVYCFYWSPQNVAYTLANIDLNRLLNDSAPNPKPLVPYFWTLMHGGGGGWRWWANLPLGDEEVRAMIALAFFAGIDGFDTWNWSGTGSHHLPNLKADADVMIGEAFSATAEGAAEPTEFVRYDVIHIVGAEEGKVRFQKVLKDLGRENYGVGEGRPTFAMAEAELAAHVRVQSAPVAAMIEALALVKPFENLLRDGEVKVDVSAQEQYAETLPIVRRVKLDGHHLLATYDPMVMFGGEPRNITLPDFDGVAGRTVILPADEQLRLFVLRDATRAEASVETEWVRIFESGGSCVEARSMGDGWRIAAVDGDQVGEVLATLPPAQPKEAPLSLEDVKVTGRDGKALGVFRLRPFGLEYHAGSDRLMVDRSPLDPRTSHLLEGVPLETKELKCSFCDKRRSQVKKLIAGPDVCICNECIDLCQEIIGSEAAAP